MSRRERIKKPRHGYYRDYKNYCKEFVKEYEAIPCHNNYNKMHGGVLARHVSISKAKHLRDHIIIRRVKKL